MWVPLSRVEVLPDGRESPPQFPASWSSGLDHVKRLGSQLGKFISIKILFIRKENVTTPEQV
jgi:hypothetical protein